MTALDIAFMAIMAIATIQVLAKLLLYLTGYL